MTEFEHCEYFYNCPLYVKWVSRNKMVRQTVGLLLICLFILTWNTARTQNILNLPVSGSFQDITLFEFLQILENRYQVNFYYVPEKMPVYKQSFDYKDVPLYEALERFLAPTLLEVVKFKEKGILLIPESDLKIEYVEQLIAKWEQGVYKKPVSTEPHVIETVFGDSSNWTPGIFYDFTGNLTDKYSGEPIVGALIRDQATGLSTVSNERGVFSIALPAGENSIQVSYLGYQTIILRLGLYREGSMELNLQVQILSLEEVVVVEKADAMREIHDVQAGVEAISIKEIKELPSFLGEADIFKSLELLPGVNSGGEASTGFNVRGGNLDQNLVMIDEALLFNTSHAIGLFSILNPDIVRNFSLYKGSIPAQYGGRLSSVLNMELKDPQTSGWKGTGGVGLASSRFVLEGPVSPQTGLIVGLRSSYSGWLLRTLEAPDIRNSRVYFGDGLIKLIHNVNDRNHLSLSVYGSHDYFRFAQDFGYSWSTAVLNLRWRYLVSNRITILTHLIRGDYSSRQFEPGDFDAFNYYSGIEYWKAKSNMTYQNDRHFIHAGIEFIRFDTSPEKLEPYNEQSSIGEFLEEKDQAWESSLYINDEIELGAGFSVSLGVRASLYQNFGPRTVYLYSPDMPRVTENTSERIVYERGEPIIHYHGIEPRFSMSYLMSDSTALKFSYNRQRQYIHLISNTSTSTPTALWQLSNTHFKPAFSDNFSIGFFKVFDQSWESSLELYYKKSDRILEFKDFADLLLNDQLETEIVSGEGKAYGLEFSFTRSYGSWTGSAAYTYSRSMVKFNSDFSEDQINKGRWFPASFDQPHQVNIQLRHQLNPLHSFQIHFTFRQGRPVTAPIGTYGVDGILVTHFSDRNQYRIPDFHRLDIAYTLDGTLSRMKGLKSSFTLALYNVYGRKNPYTIFFERDRRDVQRTYKLSVIGSIIPSLTWNFQF